MASEIDPKSAGELAENVKLTGKYAEEALDAFQKQLKVISQMRDAMEEISKVMQALCQQDCKALNPDTWKKVTKEVLKNDAATKNVSKTFKEVSTTSAKFAKALIFTAGALSSLKQGFSNVLALGKGIFGFFTSVAGGIFEIGKSILSIPFKMMSGLFKMASAGGSNELLEALEDAGAMFLVKLRMTKALVGTLASVDAWDVVDRDAGVPAVSAETNLVVRHLESDVEDVQALLDQGAGGVHEEHRLARASRGDKRGYRLPLVSAVEVLVEDLPPGGDGLAD
jgi:hypothetical protein